MANDRQNGPDDLDRRIADAQAGQRRGLSESQASAESRGWAVGIEFVGVVLVSTAIGYGVDHYAGLGTAPWVMIGMLILGFIAGVYRAQKTTVQFDADASNQGK